MASPTRTSAVLRLGDLLGYGSPKQICHRQAQLVYDVCSSVATGPEKDFWYSGLFLPPTFQSWFAITTLHVWMTTVRLRALPPSHGRHFMTALVNVYFNDIEARLRPILGRKAPERLVTQQMKAMREQWRGLGLSLDLALMTGDKDLGAAIWRNFLGARGAQGIDYQNYPKETASSPSTPQKATDPPKIDPKTGGIVDFEGSEIDKYLLYPPLMLLLSTYIRREVSRLSTISDTTLLGGEGRGFRQMLAQSDPRELKQAFAFGSVTSAIKQAGLKEGDVGGPWAK
ncbi:hypothetical protein M422DRAFT_44671 [Sphaerobolus stellatus SS14]|nr:hypothetical protein M422DRAFT_44671 [Sphaerobolus stellatus SS14]